MNGCRLYFRYLAALFMAKMQYPISFLMVCLAAFISSSIELLGIMILFERFDNLVGWTLPEIALMYGIIKMAFALADGLARGFDQFFVQVKSGDFDLALIRPRSTALQIAGQEVQMLRLGSFIQATLVLLWAFSALELSLSWHSIALALFAVAGGFCLFSGLFIVQATLAFWTTETLEMMNILTFGGADLGQYPVSIFQSWFRNFFIFVIPIGCITYFPLLAIVGKQDVLFGAPLWIGWLTPLAGLAFFGASLLFWNVGVRHYRSTGS